ncbi:hypothetical protein J5U23_01553 [Saccharolobus shibatae B12]|uniref:Uncharacterized protein n=1 Tax=Saccharolobus shibatae (strain ATCC 51178 / DSM 5389 / JCM 8931 / NBRC 15437 / B12) TaxID=523848 RepID=A0A8F5BNP2_SACSH|nr:hypothetical protein [Saccharolobus shibatae]QXJ28684.1 hypothetical protein J5U23_01553 [Saccharolobus shibatae B12]
MKVKIIYDNGKEEDIEPKKVEVTSSNDNKNYAHYKYTKMEDDKIIIFHVYLLTNEKPTVTPPKIEEEVKSKTSKIVGYKNIADDLIARARITQLQPQVQTCIYCGEIATNQYAGKTVCSSCFNYLVKYGEDSIEFRKYLNRKLLDKWK